MNFFSFILGALFSVSAMANVCSLTTNVCVDYKTDAPFATKQEGRFALVLNAELVKIDLWMQMGSHGHGSSPLKVTPVAPGEYDITKAFFVMKGAWQIRVTYKKDDVQETLIIPVMIKE
jgi:hypothetical protein